MRISSRQSSMTLVSRSSQGPRHLQASLRNIAGLLSLVRAPASAMHIYIFPGYCVSLVCIFVSGWRLDGKGHGIPDSDKLNESVVYRTVPLSSKQAKTPSPHTLLLIAPIFTHRFCSVLHHLHVSPDSKDSSIHAFMHVVMFGLTVLVCEAGGFGRTRN